MSGYGMTTSAAKSNGVVPEKKPIGLKRLKVLCERAKPGVPGRQPLCGFWVQFSGPGFARIAAGLGVDYILLDMEHGIVGDSDMHAMMPAITAVPTCSPIVRVPQPDVALVKRALDAGAHGIMFPMVSTPEEAAKAVAMTKFAPEGIRGFGSPFGPAFNNLSMNDYYDEANRSILVMVQIETPLGVKNAFDIASVPGVDMIVIGPNDLHASLGNSPRDPHQECKATQDVIEGIRRDAERAGKFSGIFCASGAEARAKFEQGFQMVNIGADTIAISSFVTNEMSKVLK
ncbi:Phosphoenolpyruvate/pyruvate domain-containing protein [Meredithblackwellia eburnea MCA 4105]